MCTHEGWAYYGIGTTQIETEIFGRCYLSGSGEGKIIQHIYPIDEITRLSESDDVGGEVVIEEIDGTRRVLRRGDVPYRLLNVLSLTNSMFGEELHRSPKFELLFGGGMEIAVLDRDGIRKLNDIVHTFFFYNPSKPDEVFIHRVMIHIDYWQGCTLLNRLSQRIGEKIELSTYIVPPMNNINIAKSYIPNAKRLFACSWLCGQVYVISDENKVLGIHSVCVEENDRDTFLKVERGERGIKLGVTNHFMNLIKEKVRYYCVRYLNKDGGNM